MADLGATKKMYLCKEYAVCTVRPVFVEGKSLELLPEKGLKTMPQNGLEKSLTFFKKGLGFF